MTYLPVSHSIALIQNTGLYKTLGGRRLQAEVLPMAKTRFQGRKKGKI